MVTSHEVAIVGGGPAGSAAARLLASWGHRVILLDRRAKALRHISTARDRSVLAESIPPSCRKLFSAIGVLEAIDAAGWYRSTGNTVWWGSDEPRAEMFAADTTGYQIDRRFFDLLLRKLAVAAGAELRELHVRDVRVSEDSAVVSADDDLVQALFVLDCSGRAGVLARRGWRIDVPGHPRTVGLVGVWTRTDGWQGVDPTHTLVESYGDGWAWSVPLSAQLRYVTTMVDPQRTELVRGRAATEVYLAELRKARNLSRLVADASLDGQPWGCDASVYVAKTYAAKPVLLVGDAASFIDPLSSYGIKKALASAWLAAVAVHTALRMPSMTTAAFEFFAAREAEMAAALLAQARAHFTEAASTHTNPFWTDRAAIVDLPGSAEPDVRVLRDDDRVQRAFAGLKARPGIALRAGATLRVETRPIVRGHLIVMEERLFPPALPGGVRFLRDVDAAGLLALAPAHDQVAALFEAYNRRFPPVALPDFLGALAVMLAFGVLEDSTASPG